MPLTKTRRRYEIRDHGQSFVLPSTLVETKSVAWHDDRRYTVANGGVVDTQGQPVTSARTISISRCLDPFGIPETFLEMRGTAIFAGFTVRHFGHFIVESLGRISIHREFPETTPILYVASDMKDREILDYQKDILNELGIKNPILLVNEPLRVERMIIPADEFNLHHPRFIAPDYLSGLNRFCAISPGSGPDLYVSRSKMGRWAGRYLAEEQLEHLLRRQGYEVFHPQDHSVAAQIQAYRRARRIIVAECSAIHLLGLLCSQGQKIAMIQRRPKPPGHLMAFVETMCGSESLAINAIEKFWADRSKKAPSYTGIALLNADRLATALLEHNFISSTSGFSEMNDGAEVELQNRGGDKRELVRR